MVKRGVRVSTRSVDIRVGDVLQIFEGQELPADILVLKTSDAGSGGRNCYVQTANLDGESDLKPRYALVETAALADAALLNVCGLLRAPPPNALIYSFNATALVSSGSDVEERELDTSASCLSVSAEQLLQQATVLKYTDHVYGVVVYTGNETKLGKNRSSSLPPKWTRVAAAINQVTVALFCVQSGVLVVFGIAGNTWKGAHALPPTSPDSQFHAYLGYSDASESRWYSIFVIPLTFMLLCSLMIPISVKVRRPPCPALVPPVP